MNRSSNKATMLQPSMHLMIARSALILANRRSESVSPSISAEREIGSIKR